MIILCFVFLALIIIFPSISYIRDEHSLTRLLKSKKALLKIADNDLDITYLIKDVNSDNEAKLDKHAHQHIINAESFAHQHNLQTGCLFFNVQANFDAIVFFNLYNFVDNYAYFEKQDKYQVKHVVYIFRRHHKSPVTWHFINQDLQHEYVLLTADIKTATIPDVEYDAKTTFTTHFVDKLPDRYLNLVSTLENHPD